MQLHYFSFVNITTYSSLCSHMFNHILFLLPVHKLVHAMQKLLISGSNDFSEDEPSSNDDGIFQLCQSNFPSTFATMNDFRLRGYLCDVTLIVGELKLPAHRVVLAATTPYFAMMFSNDFIESKTAEVTISGVEANVVASIVRCCYTGAIDIDCENV